MNKDIPTLLEYAKEQKQVGRAEAFKEVDEIIDEVFDKEGKGRYVWDSDVEDYIKELKKQIAGLNNKAN